MRPGTNNLGADKAQIVVRLYERGVRPTDLAAAFGVTQAAITHIVKGVHYPDLARTKAYRKPGRTQTSLPAPVFYEGARPRAGR